MSLRLFCVLPSGLVREIWISLFLNCFLAFSILLWSAISIALAMGVKFWTLIPDMTDVTASLFLASTICWFAHPNTSLSKDTLGCHLIHRTHNVAPQGKAPYQYLINLGSALVTLVVISRPLLFNIISNLKYGVFSECSVDTLIQLA